MKEIEFCDLCGNNKFELLFSSHDRLFNIPGDYSLCRCTKCGLFFINPQPTESEIAKHYPSQKYYSLRATIPSWKRTYYSTFFSKRGTLFLKLVFSPVFPLIRSTKIVPGGKFLDVGCGSGTFLAIMSCFNMKCYGVEPGEFDEQLAKEYSLDIKNCTVEEANYPDNYFDVITMNHVLEHVRSPTMTLRELNRILKPRGTLILAVPQSNCLAYRLFGRHWVALDIPRHLFTFSKKTMKEYLKRTGLRIDRIRYNSTSFQFQGSLLYMTNIYSARAFNPLL